MANTPRYFVSQTEGAKFINDDTWLGAALGLALHNPWVAVGGAAAGSIVGYTNGKLEEKNGVVVSPPTWLNKGALIGLLMGVAAVPLMMGFGALVVGIGAGVLGATQAAIGTAALAGALGGLCASVLGGTYMGARHTYHKMEGHYEMAKQMGTPLGGEVPHVERTGPSQLAAAYQPKRGLAARPAGALPAHEDELELPEITQEAAPQPSHSYGKPLTQAEAEARFGRAHANVEPAASWVARTGGAPNHAELSHVERHTNENPDAQAPGHGI